MLYSNRQKLADLTSKYLKFQDNVKSTRSNTYKSYATDLKQFQKSLSEFRNNYNKKSEYKNNEVAALHFALSQWSHLKLSTRNRKHACIKGFLKWLYSHNYINEPLDQHVICPKVPQKTPHFLSFDEVISLFTSLKQKIKLHPQEKTKRERNYCLILTIYAGALRVSEACQLRTHDFSWRSGAVKVLGKGGVERVITLPNNVVKELRAFECPGPYLFSFNENPLNPRTAYEIIKIAGFEADLLKPLNPHALRHSLATHLLTEGMNLRTLQKFLGHKSLAATQKYTHLGIEQLADTLNKSHPLAKDKT